MSQAEVKTVTDILPYVPSSAAAAGDVARVGGILGVVATDLAASERGSLVVNGTVKLPKITGAITRGAKVFWNPTGDPVSGTAGSGAATVTETSGSFVGYCVESVVSGDASVVVYLTGAGEQGVQQKRFRVTTAQVNAGFTLLPAIAGVQYQLTDLALIAIGGNAATATGVMVRGTQSASVVKLMDAKVAGLTQSTLLRIGTATNGVILADGASFVPNDANTAITIIKDGSDLATATHIDVLISYKTVIS
jgi:predicted RecA/RadA family phage recombinase